MLLACGLLRGCPRGDLVAHTGVDTVVGVRVRAAVRGGVVSTGDLGGVCGGLCGQGVSWACSCDFGWDPGVVSPFDSAMSPGRLCVRCCPCLTYRCLTASLASAWSRRSASVNMPHGQDAGSGCRFALALIHFRCSLMLLLRMCSSYPIGSVRPAASSLRLHLVSASSK